MISVELVSIVFAVALFLFCRFVIFRKPITTEKASKTLLLIIVVVFVALTFFYSIK